MQWRSNELEHDEVVDSPCSSRGTSRRKFVLHITSDRFSIGDSQSLFNPVVLQGDAPQDGWYKGIIRTPHLQYHLCVAFLQPHLLLCKVGQSSRLE